MKQIQPLHIHPSIWTLSGFITSSYRRTGQ